MKLPLLFALCATLCLAALPCAQAQSKIGIVDMGKVFQGYYKTNDSNTKINEAQKVAKKEIDDRLDSHKQILDEINQLNKDLDSAALSATAKTDKSKKRDDKITQIKDLEREIQDFKASRDKQIQEQSMRLRNQIVEEIMKLVEDKVKSANFDLVFDKSGQSLNGVTVVLYSRDSADFSQEIIDALNKNKPVAAATPAK